MKLNSMKMTRYTVLIVILVACPLISAYTYSVHKINVDLSDLDVVQEAVKEVVDWKELGLKLGLLWHTLSVIEEEQRGNIKRCKREMLAAWLQGEDRAREQTWSTLADALSKIDRALSNKIRKIKV